MCPSSRVRSGCEHQSAACVPSGRAGGISRRGSILVAVLGFIVLLAAVLVAFLGESIARIKYNGLFFNRDDLRVVAYSALEVSLAVLSEIHSIDGVLNGPAQGWSDPLAYAGVEVPEGIRVSVRFEDESGRIPLSATTDPALLMAFFELQEVPYATAERLTDCLIDWMDEDDLARLNGFDGDDYQRRATPILPANQRIRSWEEMRLIEACREAFFDEWGTPNAMNHSFRRAFSLFHQGQVNLNTATASTVAVLEKALQLDGSALGFYLRGPDDTAGTADDRVLLGPAEEFLGRAGGIAGTTVETLRVVIEVHRGEAHFLLTAVVRHKGANPSALVSTSPDPGGDGEMPGTRAGTARQSDVGQSLGYPFEFIRLVENQTF